MGVIAKKELLIYLTENGYSAQVIAEKTGIAKPTIYKILKQEKIKPSTAKKFCDALSIRMMEYFDLAV